MINIKSLNLLKLSKILLISLVFILAIFHRIQYITDIRKDINAYDTAITDFLSGINPYIHTIETFSNPDDPSNHGFAYLPGLLYLNTTLYIISLFSGIHYEILWKIPVLLADIGTGVFLAKKFCKKNYLVSLVFVTFWFFNPYSVLRSGYAYTDPITIFFMLLSLYYVDKDDVLAGTYFMISVALKNFPLLIFPVLLLKSKNKIKFLSSCAIVFTAISLPFMHSIKDFMTYIQGALLVHGDRFVQGRPFLFYISYFYHIELFQIIPFKIYTLLASFSGWVVSTIAYYNGWIKDKYTLALIPFLLFYIFTPVFNRTYLLWFLPIFLISTFNSFYKTSFKSKAAFYLILITCYGFFYWYLQQWNDGFHVWRPL